jgi:hypothetical protein
MATKKKVENFMREINEESDWTDLCNKEVGTFSLQALHTWAHVRSKLCTGWLIFVASFALVGTFS